MSFGMKISCWNVNGIRAVWTKGFLKWFEESNSDMVCLQEIKAKPDQLSEEQLHPLGTHSFFFPAQKPGYSGTAIYTKKEPLSVTYGIGEEKFDHEGRVLQAEYKDFILMSAYFPNSQEGGARLNYKLEFCEAMLKHCEKLRKKGKNIVLCGDFNIAHKEIDLKNPKTNTKNAGFLPQERAWMDQWVEKGYVDVFRKFESGPEFYTWWTYWANARARNIGWRIDYFSVNPEFADRLKAMEHQTSVMGSDHCPIVLNLKK